MEVRDSKLTTYSFVSLLYYQCCRFNALVSLRCDCDCMQSASRTAYSYTCCPSIFCVRFYLLVVQVLALYTKPRAVGSIHPFFRVKSRNLGLHPVTCVLACTRVFAEYLYTRNEERFALATTSIFYLHSINIFKRSKYIFDYSCWFYYFNLVEEL